MFKNLWEQLISIKDHDVYRLADPTHPMDVYAGLTTLSQRVMLVVAQPRVPTFPSSDSLEANMTRRSDGLVGVQIILKRQDLNDVFGDLCDDLMRCSRNCQTAEAGILVMHERYVRWMKLLQRYGNGTLDYKRWIGLLGELLFLDNAIDEYGVESSVSAWLGPEQCPQDFRFDNAWYEIKTISAKAQTLLISSLEQLDFTQHCGELVVVTADPSNEVDDISLGLLVDRIKSKIYPYKLAFVDFENKLLDVGYTNRTEYFQTHFICVLTRYSVGKGFPCILRDEVSRDIVAASYQITRSSIEAFKVKI